MLWFMRDSTYTLIILPAERQSVTLGGLSNGYDPVGPFWYEALKTGIAQTFEKWVKQKSRGEISIRWVKRVKPLGLSACG